jgi:hypothetical protein
MPDSSTSRSQGLQAGRLLLLVHGNSWHRPAFASL